MTQRASKHLDYGRQCYVDTTQKDGCNLYTKSRLPLKSTRGVSCPFGKDICKIRDDNLVVDTGRLDSLEHLGTNIAPEYRFQLRFVTTCAPIKTQGYTTDYNDDVYGAVKRYWYGAVEDSQQFEDFTYQLLVGQRYSPKGTGCTANGPCTEYQFESMASCIGVDEPWRPIDALKVPDSDVYIFFMSAPGIRYSAPVTDPWFSAQTPANRTHANETASSFWVQDEPLGVMACAQQFQFCNPNLPESERCEPLRGLLDPRRFDTWTKIFPSKNALDMIYWAETVFLYSIDMLSTTVYYVGASALRARYGLSHGFSGPLPANQWQLEVEHLKNGMLASLQDAFVVVANGVPEALEEFRQPPMANESMPRMMCANQKIVSNAYSSFNVMGVCLILIIGTLIILLELGLEPAISWWRRRKYRKHHVLDMECGSNVKSGHPLYSTLEWSQTSVLQLQRLAHESAGYGNWSGCDKTVPVTERGEVLACLDLNESEHPVLQAAKMSSVSDVEEQGPPCEPEPEHVEQIDSGLELSASEVEVEDLVDSEVEVQYLSHGTEARNELGEHEEPGLTRRL